LASIGIVGSAANAAVSVGWTNPPQHAEFQVGTVVNPLGSVSTSGVIGQGLDFSIVMDSSGSMFTNATATDANGNTVTKSRGDWQKEGAQLLVDGLPDNATVSIIEFDSNASTVIGQTALDAAGRAAVAAAISSVDESGGTFIGSGIDQSRNELLPGTPGFDQQMVVFSDGSTSGNPSTNAANAVAAGVESVSSVALPGAILSTMQGIASSGNGTFIDATSDIGIVTNLLGGGGGTPVGIASIEITDPDGNMYTVGSLGNVFQAGNFALNLGLNTWNVLVTDDLGNTASAQLTLKGTTGVIPLPASAWLLISGVGAIGALRRRARKS
jgi:hypothetical protein